MDELNKYSMIELQKIGNDIKEKHDFLKNEIINMTYEVQKLDDLINKKIIEMEILEKEYVKIIENMINHGIW